MGVGIELFNAPWSGLSPVQALHKRVSAWGVYLCLEGQGDLVSRLRTPTTHIIPLVIPIINLLTKSP